MPPHQQPIYESLVDHMKQLGHKGPAAVKKVHAMLKDHPSFNKMRDEPEATDNPQEEKKEI